MAGEHRTSKIRTMIVDDEPLARSSLSILLRQDSEIEVIGEYGSGREAVEHIRRQQPDIAFLDVQMPECDGFDVLELLGSKVPPAVVFVTAYGEYAARAFEAGALEYVLKPFDTRRFNLALNRAKERVAQAEFRSNRIEYLPVKSARELTFVKISDIDWIEAADYCVCLHVRGKNHVLRRSVAELEQELETYGFCRVHRSTIVNLDRIQRLAVNRSGSYEVMLKDGTRLRLSESYRNQLKRQLA